MDDSLTSNVSAERLHKRDLHPDVTWTVVPLCVQQTEEG